MSRSASQNLPAGNGHRSSPSSSPFDSSAQRELSHPDTSAAPQSQSNKQAATKVSCLECRSSKVKCLPQRPHEQIGLGQPGIRCARCERLDKPCVFEKHKRGRKPDSWKYGRLEKQLESILSELKSDREGGGGGKASSSTKRTEGTEADSPGSDEPAQKRLRTETAEILSNWRAHSAASGGSKSERVAALSKALEQRQLSESADEGAESRRQHGLKREDPLPETGLPSLSNPLKLLAQASAGGEAFGEDGEADRTGSRPATSHGTSSKPTSPRPLHRKPLIAPPGSLGIYEEKLENGPDLDPIIKNLISLENAQYLWSIFLDKLSHPFMLLDSKVYTFEYTRPRSSMLLSVGLALTARFIPATNELPTDVIADEIDKHVLKKIIPTLILEGKRSQHCAKALMLLAAYNGQTIPLSEDRSFSYVSWAFSMCVELDLNRRLFSMSADQNDEVLQRSLRERERTFLEAWAYSFSIALHHGRRCNLSIHDPVVAAASQWHRSPYSIPEDQGLVSNIQLRQLIARNLDYFLQHVAPAMPKTSADGPPDQACRLLLEFHRKSITEDLDAWHATWVVPVVSEARPFRLHSTAYYHAYATLILHSLPMKHGTEMEPVLKPFSDQAHQAALSVVAYYLRLPQEQIIWGHNSIHITVGFAVVYALRETEPGASLVEMVQDVIKLMEMAANVTPHRRGFASGVARFLSRVLSMRKNVDANTAIRRASNSGASSTSPAEDSSAANAALMSNSFASSTSPASSTASAPPIHAMAPAAAAGSDLPPPPPHHLAAALPTNEGVPAHASAGAAAAAPTYGFGANLFESVPNLGSHPNADTTQSAADGLFASTATAQGYLNSGGGGGSAHLGHPHNNHNHSSAAGTAPPPPGMDNLFADLAPPHNMSEHAADQSASAAMMDTLMMDHPIGVQFNSLLGQTADWGNDWSFFLPGAGAGGESNGNGNGEQQ